jgi:sec-independent protein translocase protein TatC
VLVTRRRRSSGAPEPAAPAELSVLDHLSELRDRIIKSAAAVVVGAVVCWFLYPAIFDVLVDPYCNLQGATLDDCRLLQTEPLEAFSIRLKIAGYGGIALAMPVLLWQVWRFVVPGLHVNEKRWAYPFVGSALVLFVLGAALAFHTLTPALEFLTEVGGEGLQQHFRPAPYFELITYMMLAFGVGFEFPIVLVFLQLAGVVTASSLRSARRYALVGIVVVVAVITPSGDPYTLGILSIPMYLFYEASILIGMLLTRRSHDR